MAYLGGITASLMSTVFIIFLIAAVGYLVGGISIKGISLGSAGVLLIALIFGIVASYIPYITIGENILFCSWPSPPRWPTGRLCLEPTACSPWSPIWAPPCL